MGFPGSRKMVMHLKALKAKSVLRELKKLRGRPRKPWLRLIQVSRTPKTWTSAPGMKATDM